VDKEYRLLFEAMRLPGLVSVAGVPPRTESIFELSRESAAS
jgi:hypothetical protein